MCRIIAILIAISVCLLTGFIASRLQMDSLASWYPSLNKPSLTPPDWIFPLMWTILYILMGISAGIAVTSCHRRQSVLAWLFIAQLIVNFCWSIAFFYLQNPMLGLIVIILLDILVVTYAILAWKASKTASILFFPYIAWIGFATWLNAAILMLN